MNDLMQHRVRNTGQLLDLIRQGNKTSLESIECDVMVAKNDGGAPELFVGHPGEIRSGEYRPMPAAEFFDSVGLLSVKQLMIDCRANGWNAEFARDAFTPEELEVLFKALDILIHRYHDETTGDGIIRPEHDIIINAKAPEVFAYLDAHPELCKEAVRYYAPIATEMHNPFEAARQYGAVGMVLPVPQETERTQQLQEWGMLAKQLEYQDIVVTIVPVNDAAIEKEIHNTPGLERAICMSDATTTLEESRRETGRERKANPPQRLR